MTLAELSAALWAVKLQTPNATPVLYCHPLDLERVEHAVALLPEVVPHPLVERWNAAEPGQVILSRVPARPEG